MKVRIQSDTSHGAFTVDADYNETVENLLVKCSLRVLEVPIERLVLRFNGVQLSSRQRLDIVGYEEGQTINLQTKHKIAASKACCSLV